jgi:hypothetical protein
MNSQIIQQWPEDNAEFKREVLIRMFILRKLDDLGIHPSMEAAAAVAQQRIIGPISKTVGPITLNEFSERFLKKQGIGATDLEQFLRHEAGVNEMVMSAGQSGALVTPGEAESLYRIEHRMLYINLASFAVSNYADNIPVTTEALSGFYSNQMANYRLPERIQVNFVKYDLTNYLVSAQTSLTNLDRLVDENYQNAGTNAVPGAKTPEEAKAKIREAIIHQAAFRDARRDAGDLAQKLYNAFPTNRNLKLETLATNLTVQTTPPFSEREYGPPGMNVLPSFSKAAFELSPAQPFSGAVLSDDGVYVLAFERKIASEIPALKDIEARVTADYRNQMALQMARQAAANFAVNLNNGLIMGKTFSNLCDEAKVKPETPPPFALGSTDIPKEIEDRFDMTELKTNAFNTPVGSVSPVINTPDSSYIIHMIKQVPPDEGKVKQESPALLNDMRRARQSEAFNKWFVQQLQQDSAYFKKINDLAMDAENRAASSRGRP